MVCLPLAGFGHEIGWVQPAAAPLPTHVRAPSSPGFSVVVVGSQTAGGNIGTHWVPWIIVNGPHIAVPVVSSAGWQVPSRSMVPVPQSMLLHAGTAVMTYARS